MQNRTGVALWYQNRRKHPLFRTNDSLIKLWNETQASKSFSEITSAVQLRWIVHTLFAVISNAGNCKLAAGYEWENSFCVCVFFQFRNVTVPQWNHTILYHSFPEVVCDVITSGVMLIKITTIELLLLLTVLAQGLKMWGMVSLFQNIRKLCSCFVLEVS